MVTQSYRFTSLQLSKSKNPRPCTGNCCSISHTHIPLTQSEDTFPFSQELSTSSYQGPNKPSSHLPQYLYNTDFQKILWCRHSKIVLISLPDGRNYHANATKGIKCIKPYRYKKSSLRSETTESKRWRKIPKKKLFRSYKSLEYDDTILLSAHRHIAVTMVSLKAGNVLQPSITWLLAALLEGTA